MPSAMMKGTVIGPVVTPPESNATAMNSLGTKMAITNTRIYETHSMCNSLIWKRMRSSATTKNSPTPTATVRINTGLGMEGTWLANTVRSGSAIVTTAPIAKQSRATSQSFLDFVMPTPMPSPIGIMAISTPS